MNSINQYGWLTAKQNMSDTKYYLIQLKNVLKTSIINAGNASLITKAINKDKELLPPKSGWGFDAGKRKKE